MSMGVSEPQAQINTSELCITNSATDWPLHGSHAQYSLMSQTLSDSQISFRTPQSVSALARDFVLRIRCVGSYVHAPVLISAGVTTPTATYAQVSPFCRRNFHPTDGHS